MEYAENIRLFMITGGITMFLLGGILCFIALTFRYGVLCTLLANISFVGIIVFPKQINQFITNYQMIEFFNHDPSVIRVKAVIAALVVMIFLWGLRWLKHFIIEGVFYFLFPNVIKPQTVAKLKVEKS